MSLAGVQVHLVDDWDTAQRFMAWLGERRNVLGVDTETHGLDWWSSKARIRTTQIGDQMTGWVLPHHRWSGLVEEIARTYEGAVALHNAKYDMKFFALDGIKWGKAKIHDTLLMAHTHNPNDAENMLGLKDMSAKYISPAANHMAKELASAMTKNGWDWDTVPLDLPEYWQYGGLDPVFTARIYDLYDHMVGRPIYEMEMACSWVLNDMETAGMLVDDDYCIRQIGRLNSFVQETVHWLRTAHGIDNPNSPQQLAAHMLSIGWEPQIYTPGGKPSTKDEAIQLIPKDDPAYTIGKAVLDIRHSKKMAQDYLQKMLDFRDDHGRVHCGIKQVGTRTGRMSITDPPLQTLHRDALVRDSFIAAPGHKLVLVDYDQMELRLMAHFGDVPLLLDAIAEGRDLHTMTAQLVYGLGDAQPTKAQRQVAKNIGFAKIYGTGIDTFADTAKISRDEAVDSINAYDRAYPQVKDFSRALIASEQSKSDPSVTTPAGRHQPVDKNYEYRLVNYLIQGTGADILKEKIIALDQAGLGQYMRLPVHDEIIFEVPEEDAVEVAAAAKEIMEVHDRFRCPLTVGPEIVDRWGDPYAHTRG